MEAVEMGDEDTVEDGDGDGSRIFSKLLHSSLHLVDARR